MTNLIQGRVDREDYTHGEQRRKRSMILKLNKVELADDKYGKHIVIKMVTAYDDEMNYIKHVKLTDEVVKVIKETVVMGPFEIFNGLLVDNRDG